MDALKRHGMRVGRRAFTAAIGTMVLATTSSGQPPPTDTGDTMFGLIGKMTAAPGRRDDLIGILLESVSGMPGCLSYVVARDPSDADAIWITEIWDSQTSHKASLSLPSVQQAIAKGKALIARLDQSIVTEPVGGQGLPVAPR